MSNDADRPTIAYLTTYYTGDIDGRLGRFHDWVHRLRDRPDPPFDAEVHAFTVGTPDEMLAETPKGVLGGGEDLWGRRRNKLEFLLHVPRIRRSLRRSDFDLLHLIQLDTILFPTGAIRREEPVVVGPDILGWNPIRSGGRWDLKFPGSLFTRSKYDLKRVLAATAWYDAATAYSEYHRRMLERLGIPREDVTVLPPGVDPRFAPNERRPADGPTHVLYVGDISAHKGFPTLVEALYQLEHEVQLTVIGAGEPPRALPESVEFLGFLHRADLPEHYRRADIYVTPSIDEAGPNTIVESLASGVPVVATDRPGLNAYAPEDASVLFDPRAPGALASAIDHAIDNLPTLTCAARRQANDFDIDRVLDSLDTLYRRCINDR